MIPSLALLQIIAALLTLSRAAGAAESVTEMLLRVAGLTASPIRLRGENSKVDSGDIWGVSSDGAPPTALTSGGGYRSPVFSPADGTIVALKGDTVVRIPASGGAVERLHDVPGLIKLVGFDPKNADDIVVLLNSGRSPLGLLSLSSGKVLPLPYDQNSDREEMLSQIRGQDRFYGDVSVYVDTETKRGLSRILKWTDVYLQRGDSPPQNVSSCDGARCGQPALSPDGRRVAFVKSGD